MHVGVVELYEHLLRQQLVRLMEMDTDFLYIAFARDIIDECVKPELVVEWVIEKCKWFCSEKTAELMHFVLQK